MKATGGGRIQIRVAAEFRTQGIDMECDTDLLVRALNEGAVCMGGWTLYTREVRRMGVGLVSVPILRGVGDAKVGLDSLLAAAIERVTQWRGRQDKKKEDET